MTQTESRDRQYTAMARVYDEWIKHDIPPYDAWTGAIDRTLRQAALNGVRIFELGCGTGAISSRLQQLGWNVTGVDASPDMITIAKRKFPGGPAFVQMRLPDAAVAQLGKYDAAIACFDTVNYLAEPGQLRDAFTQIGEMLEPGGVFMFDVNTQYRLEKLFGQYHSGDDFETFAYVWRNRYRPDEQSCHIELTFFIRRPDGAYDRFTERHVERWFSRSEIIAALAAAGMELTAENAAYTDESPVETTHRVTYVATKAGLDRLEGARR